MTSKTKSDLAWVRAEIAKNPDQKRYELLQNTETAILKRKIEEEFEEAAQRTEQYSFYRKAVDIAMKIGYTDHPYHGGRLYGRSR